MGPLTRLAHIVFYPFARDLWLAWDLHFRPSEEGAVVRREHE